MGDTEYGLTNSEIDNVAHACGFAEEEPNTKWKRVFNILAKDQNTRGNGNGVLAFVRKAMRPAIYVSTPERYETLRENLNRALVFEGMAIERNGKLASVDTSNTINDARRKAAELRGSLQERGVHPDVLSFCREELLADNYFHAVLEASKSLAQKVRDKTGLTEDGSSLIDKALSGASPLLTINKFATETEKSEQKGFAMLCKGVFGMFRNPTSHAPRVSWEMNRADAEDLMSLLSLLHRRLDSNVKSESPQ
ncbi:TIGR02391 family protein [Aliiroseovarius sp. M344]|uniref:TIGR02391 family protein n=1 Tax=Aliiroseovarius sp. M344 TaxID=2867010 RepID=UPI0021AE230A|nr:TIGR02391 family protein [Aliiroseovarius sp. M344]UWQ14889.1 TIGR02391 family protein [Aliiroseovarius sp. M344]